MKNLIQNFAILTALMGFMEIASAQVYLPLSISSGYNEGVIASSYPASNSTTTGLDALGTQTNVFYDPAYSEDSGLFGGELTNGTAITTSDGDSFIIPSATNANDLLLNTDESTGTLSFLTPTNLGSISILDTAANGDQLLDYTLNFVGGSSTSGNLSISDWYDPSAIGAFNNLGRIDFNTDQFDSENGNVFSLYESTIAIPDALQSLSLSSVTFTFNGQGTGEASILAISGTSPVPEPSTYALVGLSTLILAVGYRRRRHS